LRAKSRSDEDRREADVSKQARHLVNDTDRKSSL
jgi:hypothetical protein